MMKGLIEKLLYKNKIVNQQLSGHLGIKKLKLWLIWALNMNGKK